MLVLNRLLITLPSLLLENDLHFAFGVLQNRCLHPNSVSGNSSIASEGVLAGANFVDLVQGDDVTHTHVFETRDCQHVARS
jgi:hypothetical protein